MAQESKLAKGFIYIGKEMEILNKWKGKIIGRKPAGNFFVFALALILGIRRISRG
jgi:hypothetical protein